MCSHTLHYITINISQLPQQTIEPLVILQHSFIYNFTVCHRFLSSVLLRVCFECICSEGGFFKAHLTFSKDYPVKPPKMKFVTEIWHPNSKLIFLNAEFDNTSITSVGFYFIVIFLYYCCDYVQQCHCRELLVLTTRSVLL